MFETKQFNVRISTEDAEKFRVFCEENKMSQAQGFSRLMEMKDINPDAIHHYIKVNDVELIMLYSLVKEQVDEMENEKKKSESNKTEWDYEAFCSLDERLTEFVRMAVKR